MLADWPFTSPAVVIQPVTGFWMAHIAGFSLTSFWLLAAIHLYVLVGACWLPVVWLQVRMHAFAREARRSGAPLPVQYFRYARIWFALGWPAFIGVIAIFCLMVFKPGS